MRSCIAGSRGVAANHVHPQSDRHETSLRLVISTHHLAPPDRLTLGGRRYHSATRLVASSRLGVQRGSLRHRRLLTPQVATPPTGHPKVCRDRASSEGKRTFRSMRERPLFPIHRPVEATCLASAGYRAT